MRDEDELERLRAHYARLERAVPGADVDDAVRAAARRAVARPRLRAWSAAIASAACIGLAVVLVPMLLIESPAPALHEREAELLVTVKRESAERERRIEMAERQRARQTPMAVAPAPVLQAPREMSSKALEDAAADTPAFSAAPDLAALRAALEDASESTWRERILALRDAGHEPLAATLLADFRERFDRPAEFTLADLAAEAPRE